MSKVDKQIPSETLAVLLQHKKEVLDNISQHYQIELADANADNERLFKYGFIFVSLLETTTAALAITLTQQEDVLLFVLALLLLTLAVVGVLYERVRIEKSELRRHANKERDPILQQIVLLKSFLEPEEKQND